jgi:hypothetical protein
VGRCISARRYVCCVHIYGECGARCRDVYSSVSMCVLTCDCRDLLAEIHNEVDLQFHVSIHCSHLVCLCVYDVG